MSTTEITTDNIEDVITETVLSDHPESRLLRRVLSAADRLSHVDGVVIQLATRVEQSALQVRFDVEAGRHAHDHFSQAAAQLAEAIVERRCNGQMLRALIKSVDDEALRDQLTDIIDG